jgi:hypothetical protein
MTKEKQLADEVTFSSAKANKQELFSARMV